MLKNGASSPAGWAELAMFEPARAYPSRHRCVLLAVPRAAGGHGGRPGLMARPASDQTPRAHFKREQT
jgi:hypothetical protein